MEMIIVPPIKSQGIKTKLSSWIKECAKPVKFERWVEPFLGTGSVVFNVNPRCALLCDNNPYIVNFYIDMQNGAITGRKARNFLEKEGEKLFFSGGEHYYAVRERFNEKKNPLDFLFLNRACFNGMMRFNGKGQFNVPFCRKPERFAPALISKICNQIDRVSVIIKNNNFVFKHQDFVETLNEVCPNDLIYCDPPYAGRHVGYFDSWTEERECELASILADTKAYFMLSTWIKNKYRTNDALFSIWADFFISTKNHFYHVGAKEENRHEITEALISNFDMGMSCHVREVITENICVATASVEVRGREDEPSVLLNNVLF